MDDKDHDTFDDGFIAVVGIGVFLGLAVTVLSVASAATFGLLSIWDVVDYTESVHNTHGKFAVSGFLFAFAWGMLTTCIWLIAAGCRGMRKAVEDAE